MAAGLFLVCAFIEAVLVLDALGLWETSGALRIGVGVLVGAGDVTIVFDVLRRVGKERASLE